MVRIDLKSLNSQDFYDNKVSLYDNVSDYSIFYLINNHLYLLKVLVGQCELWVKTFMVLTTTSSSLPPTYQEHVSKRVLKFGANGSELDLNSLKFMVQIWSEFGASQSEFKTLHPGKEVLVGYCQKM